MILIYVLPIQSTATQSLSKKDGTTEIVGVVYWHHSNDITAMENSDRSTWQTGTRGTKRWG